MGKYEALAKDIVKNVGGKSNIISIMHCVTRLRFNLKDEGKAKDEIIKEMDGVVTLIKSGGQYQVVIGNHVPQVYAEVCSVAGIAENKEPAPNGKKMGIGATLLDLVQAIMLPCIGVMCATGILKGFLSLFVSIGIMSNTGSTYTLLYAISDCLMYFFPIFLGYTAANKFGFKTFLGMAIGASMVYPTIQGVDLVFFGNTFNAQYTATVFPVIIVCLFAKYVDKLFNKIIPDVVKSFVAPLCTLLVSVPIGFLFIGPVVNLASNALGNGLAAVTDFNPILAGLLIGAIWQVLVVFGVHAGLIMIAIVDLSMGNSNMIYAFICLPSFAQTAAVFAIWMKTKNKKLKDIALPAWISGIFGVTEPAIYGVTLPRIKIFILTCIGGGLSAAWLGLTGTTAYVLAGMGVFSIPSFLSPSGGVGVLVNVGIATLIGVAFTFVTTMILFKDEDKTVPTSSSGKKIQNASKFVINTPVQGNIIPLSKVEDAAFSGGILGKGAAVEPTEGKVYAPGDGVLTTLFPTLHALGITLDNGVEMLIHIGMDTVKLEGRHFKAKVSQGQKISKGQVLMEFDIKAIKQEGYSTITPVIITNTEDYLDIVETNAQDVALSEALFDVILKKDEVII